MFECPVELEDKVILRRLAENDAQALVVGAFREAIRALSNSRETADLLVDRDLSSTSEPIGSPVRP